jgi:hypothetical protein
LQLVGLCQQQPFTFFHPMQRSPQALPAQLLSVLPTDSCRLPLHLTH